MIIQPVSDIPPALGLECPFLSTTLYQAENFALSSECVSCLISEFAVCNLGFNLEDLNCDRVSLSIGRHFLPRDRPSFHSYLIFLCWIECCESTRYDRNDEGIVTKVQQ